MKRKLVVFDLDGTLIDSLNSSAVCIQKVLSTLRHRDFTLAQIQSHFGQPEEFVFRQLCGEQDVSDLMTAYLDEIKRNMHLFPLYEGANELLSELKKQNVRFALCTARGDQATAVILKEHKLFDHFEKIITGNDVKVQKPDAEGLRGLIKHFGADANEVYFVGDSPADWQAAHDVGAIGIRALWGAHPENKLFDHLHSFENLNQFSAFFFAPVK